MGDSELGSRRLMRAMRRHKWIAILLPLLAAVLVYVSSRATPALYAAESLIKVTPLANSMQALLVNSPDFGSEVAANTVLPLPHRLKAEIALELTGAERHPGRMSKTVGKVSGTESLADQIDVTVNRRAEGIFAVRATDTSEDRALALANAAAHVLVRTNREERGQEIEHTVSLLRQRVAETEQLKDASEKQEEDFRTTHAEVMGLENTDRSGVEDRLKTLTRTVEALETSIDRLSRGNDAGEYLAYAPPSPGLQDPVVPRLEEQLLKSVSRMDELKARRKQLLRTRTQASPEVRKLTHEIEAAQQDIDSTAKTMVSRYQSIRIKLAAEQSALERRLHQFELLPAALQQFDVLQRTAEGYAETLAGLQNKLQDAEIQKATELQNMKLVQAAVLATPVSRLSVYWRLLAVLLIALVLGGLIAVVLESFDTSLGSVAEVERYLGIPVLGIVPSIDFRLIRGVIERKPGVPQETLADMATLAAHFDSSSAVAEAFRLLRTQIGSLLEKNRWKTVLMTSSVPGEGKTSIACNLGIVFAQAGKKTLVVDANLRSPRVNRVFGIAEGPGLSDVLTESVGCESAIRSIDDLVLGRFGLRNAHFAPGLEYLFLLSSGTRVDRPAELLNMKRFQQVLSDLSQHFDVIIVDGAAMMPMADSSILAPLTDGTLLTYEVGRVGRETVERSKTRLEGLGAKPVGLVMNDIRGRMTWSDDYRQYGNHDGKRSWLFSRLRGRIFRAAHSGPRRPFRGEEEKTSEASSESAARAMTSTDLFVSATNRELDEIMRLTDEE